MMMSDTILKKEWFLLEKLYQYIPLALEPPILAMTYMFKDEGLAHVTHSIHEFRDRRVNMFFIRDEWDGAARRTAGRLAENPSLLDNLHRESDREIIPAMMEVCDEIIHQDLARRTDEELAVLYERLHPLQARLHAIRAIGWVMETGGEVLSDHLVSRIRECIKKTGASDDPMLAFSLLITPTRETLAMREHHDLLKLADRVRGGEIELNAGDPAIQAHARNYRFLTYGCEGPGADETDCMHHVQALLDEGHTYDAQLKDENERNERIDHERTDVMRRLQFDETLKRLFDVTRDIVYQKAWSKEHQFYNFYALDVLLREVGRRTHTGIQQLRYLLPHELPHMIRSGEADEHTLNERIKHGLLIIDETGSRFAVGPEAERIMTAMHRVDAVPEVDMSTDRLEGTTAVPGTARGIVKIINTIEDMPKMEKGDILVSEMTIPEIVSAMKKAAAIVTDAGGITCHAAIVSRELGIPCVIGTKIATTILKDGDQVEVDATRGVVRKV